MNETTKQSPVTTVTNFFKRNQTRILIGTTVLSTTGAVLMYRNVSALNEFLKEHDLLDQFYGTTEEIV